MILAVNEILIIYVHIKFRLVSNEIVQKIRVSSQDLVRIDGQSYELTLFQFADMF